LYQVLYRKWRSQTFGEVSGQPHVTTTLRRALATGRLGHAYLFTGPRGTGKTSCARIFAKSVNCLHPVDGEPCNECELCRGIDAGSVMDVIEIDAASNNGVDNIRDLREETSFLPSQGKFRVYIIDEVHMLSSGAFNALLKTLEEPPPYVIFILATTEVHKLPATVLSRCQRFDFHRISAEEIAKRLLFIAGQEQFTLEADAAMLLARVADGAMRDALSLLDRCRVDAEEVTAAHVARCIGMADRHYLFELTDALLAGEIPLCLELLHQLYQDACDMERLCEDLLFHLRNLLVLLVVRQPRDLVICTEDDFVLYRRQADKTSAARLLQLMERLEAANANLRRSTDKRMEMEITLIKLCTSNAQPKAEAPPAQITPPKKADAPNLQAAQPTSPPQEPQAGEFARWGEVLSELQNTNPPLAGILVGSTAFTRDDFVLIKSENPAFPMFIKQGMQAASLKEAIARVTGGERPRLGLFRAEGEEAAAPKDPLARLAERAEMLSK
jgi:DNA polymerase-3 subunit gamma/tau